MSNTPDLETLARRYLDLWQDQMARMARDPATAETIERTFALMTKSAEAFAAAKVNDEPPATADRGDAARAGQPSAHTEHSPPTGPAGAAPAAPVSGTGGDDLSRLAGRIARLEERVAELEQQLAGCTAAAAPAPAPKRRSRRPAGGSPAA
ncbi:hypothetical protein GCM10027396_04870 [Insolitispirillum peregrinum]